MGRSHKTSVLLVDDDALIRASIQAALGALGHRVSTAATGLEGLAVLDQHPHEFDCLVVDVLMPELDGIQMSERVQERWGDIPTVFISGYTGSRCLQTETNVPRRYAFLPKPFRVRELSRTIQELLAARARKPSTAAREATHLELIS